jgi:hypothetical protein
VTNLACIKPLQSATFRVTRLDDCGTPLFEECSYAVSDGYTQVEITPNTTDGQTFQQLNAGGVALVNQQARTILNWFDYQIIMAVKDPELFFLMTGADLFLDYGGLSAGNVITPDNYATGTFALEVWLGTAQEACPPNNAPYYGYILLPFTVDGKLTESITIANDLITYTFAGRTRTGTDWGVGPYDVMLDGGGLPAPLPTAISTNTHYLDLITQLPPPEPDCGCLALVS